MRRRESGLAILALVSLIVGWLWALPRPSFAAEVAAGATLSILDEPVVVTRLDGAVVAAADGQSLAVGEVVRTGVGGRALLTFFDGSTAELGSESAMIVERAERGTGGETVLELWQAGGTVVHRVASLLGGSAYQVHTPSSVAMVRGTIFRTSVAAVSQEASIEVFRGFVQVAGRVGEPVHVQPGETTVVGWQRPPQPPAPNPVTPPDEQPPRQVAPPAGPAPRPIDRPVEDRPRPVPEQLRDLVGDAPEGSPPAGGLGGFEWDFLVSRRGQGSPALEGTVLGVKTQPVGDERAQLAIVATRDGDIRAVALPGGASVSQGEQVEVHGHPEVGGQVVGEVVAQVASPAASGAPSHGRSSASRGSSSSDGPVASASRPPSDRSVAAPSPGGSGQSGAGPSEPRRDAAGPKSDATQGQAGAGEPGGSGRGSVKPASSSAAPSSSGSSQDTSAPDPPGGGSTNAGAAGAQQPSHGDSQGSGGSQSDSGKSDGGQSSGGHGSGSQSDSGKSSGSQGDSGQSDDGQSNGGHGGHSSEGAKSKPSDNGSQGSGQAAPPGRSR